MLLSYKTPVLGFLPLTPGPGWLIRITRHEKHEWPIHQRL